MNPVPGFGGPSLPAAPAPVPTREDPALADARRKSAAATRKRKGRRAANLTGGDLDELGAAPVARPTARSGARIGLG